LLVASENYGLKIEFDWGSFRDGRGLVPGICGRGFNREHVTDVELLADQGVSMKALVVVCSVLAVWLGVPSFARAASFYANADSSGVKSWVIQTGVGSSFGGDYTVYARCEPQEAGPGYVARYTNRHGGQLVDDVGADYNGLAQPEPGLGKFVFRDFRQGDDTAANGPGTPVASSSSGPANAWGIAGSMCANAPVNQPPANQYDHADIVGGLGVTATSVLEAPNNPTPNMVELAVSVQFGDYYNRDILHVIYHWQFTDPSDSDHDDAAAKMWTQVAIDCASRGCMQDPSNQKEWFYVKGPKFVAGLNGVTDSANDRFTRVTTFTDAGTIASYPNGTTTAYCTLLGSDPSTTTNKCPTDTRQRIRFDYGTTASSTVGGCTITKPCLNAVFRAIANTDASDVAPGAATLPWENSQNAGLDGWAVAENDYASGGASNSGCTASGTMPGGQGERKWEEVGYKTAGVYTAVAGFFFGWLDCTTVPSGSDFYRVVPSKGGDPYGLYQPGASWGTFGSFSENDAIFTQ